MQCREVRQQLDTSQDASAIGDEVLAHLRDCTDCRDYTQELRVTRLLRTLPMPASTEGFEKRVIDNALTKVNPAEKRIGPGPTWWLATAASVMFAVMTTLLLVRPDTVQRAAEFTHIQSQGQVLPVSMILNNQKPLGGATITVHIPPNIALEGYPGKRRLQWQVDLNAGDHKLTLPVVVGREHTTDNTGCEILIEVEHDGKRKQFWVPIQRETGNDKLMKTGLSA